MPANFSDVSMPWFELEVDWPLHELACELEVVAPRMLTTLEWVLERILDEFQEDPPTLEEAAEELGMKDPRFLRDTFDSLLALGALQVIDAEHPKELSNARLTERGREMFRKGRIDAAPAHHVSCFVLDTLTQTHMYTPSQHRGSESKKDREDRKEQGKTQEEPASMTVLPESSKNEVFRTTPKCALINQAELPPLLETIGLDRARALSVAQGEPHHRGESAIRAARILPNKCRRVWKPIRLALVFQSDGVLTVGSSPLHAEQFAWLLQHDLNVSAFRALEQTGKQEETHAKRLPLIKLQTSLAAPPTSDTEYQKAKRAAAHAGFWGPPPEPIPPPCPSVPFVTWQAGHTETIAPQMLVRRAIDLIRAARRSIVLSGHWLDLDGVEQALEAAAEKGVACFVIGSLLPANLTTFHEDADSTHGFVLHLNNDWAPSNVLIADGLDGIENSTVSAHSPGGRALLLDVSAVMAPERVASELRGMLKKAPKLLEDWQLRSELNAIFQEPRPTIADWEVCYRLLYASFVLAGDASLWYQLVNHLEKNLDDETRLHRMRAWADVYSRVVPLLRPEGRLEPSTWKSPIQNAWRSAFGRWRETNTSELPRLERLLDLAVGVLEPEEIVEGVLRAAVSPAPAVQDRAPLLHLLAVRDVFKARWPKFKLDSRLPIWLQLMDACLKLPPPTPAPQPADKALVALIVQEAEPAKARAWAEAQSKRLETPTTLPSFVIWVQWHSTLRELLEPELTRRAIDLWVELCARDGNASAAVLNEQLQVIKDALGKGLPPVDVLSRRLGQLEQPDPDCDDVWSQIEARVRQIIHLREAAQRTWSGDVKLAQHALWGEALGRMLILPRILTGPNLNQAELASTLGALTSFSSHRARWGKALSAAFPPPVDPKSMVEWLEFQQALGDAAPPSLGSDAAMFLSRISGALRGKRGRNEPVVERLCSAWKALRLPSTMLAQKFPSDSLREDSRAGDRRTGNNGPPGTPVAASSGTLGATLEREGAVRAENAGIESIQSEADGERSTVNSSPKNAKKDSKQEKGRRR